ncbi:hypothetical protein RZS08_43850, partial [Arthrospira platensis SPKY1]|nr:hypothetical protein [Arthrospira platensis SPKY1]
FRACKVGSGKIALHFSLLTLTNDVCAQVPDVNNNNRLILKTNRINWPKIVKFILIYKDIKVYKKRRQFYCNNQTTKYI